VNFVIADTFLKSLAQLDHQSQTQAKQTAFDFQSGTTQPSHQFHRIEKSKDRNFWSLRVSDDVRIIVYQERDTRVLCYVDHHDKAYDWAERRRFAINPHTGAA